MSSVNKRLNITMQNPELYKNFLQTYFTEKNIKRVNVDYKKEFIKAYREALEKVKNEGNSLRYMSPAFKNHKAIVMAAVKDRGEALQFAGNDAKNNIEIVITAVKQTSWAICHAGDEAKNNIEVAINVIKKSHCRYYYIGSKLKANKFLTAASKIENHEDRAGFCDKLLKNIRNPSNDIIGLFANQKNYNNVVSETNKKSKLHINNGLCSIQ
jgi:ABC-type transporter MlaC component